MPDPTIDPMGNRFWYNDRYQYHREDGPAIVFRSGSQYWYRDGKRHREDGPAIIHPYKPSEWYLNDISYTEDAYRTIQFFNGVKLND